VIGDVQRVQFSLSGPLNPHVWPEQCVPSGALQPFP
jgi:hypothetical protein